LFHVKFPNEILLTIVLFINNNPKNSTVTIQCRINDSVSGNEPNNTGGTNSTYSGGSAINKCNCNSDVKVNINLQFTINGVDIGDSMCVVEGNTDYFPEKQFPRELIGVTGGVELMPISNPESIVSNFFYRPDYVSVMKGKGCTVWERAKSARIKNTDCFVVTNESDVDFFRGVCAFMVFRYYLGGLSSGKFSVKWLLQENTKKFYESLRNSDFCAFEEVFTLAGYNKYERYMKYSLCD